MVGALSAFVTYLLVLVLIIGVIGMNISIIKDERFKTNGVMYAFTSRKLYLWFMPLAAIFFTVFLINA